MAAKQPELVVQRAVGLVELAGEMHRVAGSRRSGRHPCAAGQVFTAQQLFTLPGIAPVPHAFAGGDAITSWSNLRSSTSWRATSG